MQKMQRRTVIRAGAAGLGAAMWGQTLYAQQYPNGSVTIILPLQAGSASDVAIRHLSERLAQSFKTGFVVENIAAAAGVVGLEKLSRAKPDGQTLAALNNSIIAILPHLQPQNVKVDTRKDFLPIAGIANIPTFFAVGKQSPIKDIHDLVARARKDPDRITYASGGVGSPQHLATEMFKSYSGAKLVHVPYRGATQATVAVVAGEVDVMSMALPLAQPFLPDGRIRLIGYCGAERHPQFREVPTLAEQGVAKYDYSTWISLFVHKDVPPDIVAALRRESAAIVNDKAFQVKLISSGMDPWPRSADQLSKIVAEDYVKWQKIIADARIQGA
ncbi:MAG: tripartite tricarboxylate transporter substrate binding protein [Comamonadaceae bacterium]|nr:MAG: tripartite tricarboxylate transporter substrate binding protein [Comamonadaceae bacterium]